MKKNSILALVLAGSAFAMEIESRLSLEHRIDRLVDARERAYCKKLAVYLNKTRALTGSPPVEPRNFAEVLEFYFRGMADVMERAGSDTGNAGGINKEESKP